MAALLHAFSGNEIAVEYSSMKYREAYRAGGISRQSIFAIVPIKPFWPTPENHEITTLTCSPQKPTALPILGFFEKQPRDRRACELQESHGIFINPFDFLGDFVINNQHDLAEKPVKNKKGAEV